MNKENTMSHADNRRVVTDALETLGTIIGLDEKRDAIHLAVEPIEAGSILAPGERICIIDGKAYTGSRGKPVGIVDPFLDGPVRKGERFWLVVFPRQIVSLRHVWEHPEFPPSGETDSANPGMHPSEKWIRDWCATIPLDYEVVMAGADEWVRDKERGGWGEYLCFGGLLEGEFVPDEFWTHYDAVMGRTTPENHRGSFFTCSC